MISSTKSVTKYDRIENIILFDMIKKCSAELKQVCYLIQKSFGKFKVVNGILKLL